MRDLSCRVAQRLHSLGYAPGTNGAVLAPNDALGFVCSLGLLRAGVAWIPLNPRDAIAQIGVLLDRLDARVLFVSSAFRAGIASLHAAAPGVREVVVYDEELEEWLADAPSQDVVVADDPGAMARRTGISSSRRPPTRRLSPGCETRMRS